MKEKKWTRREILGTLAAVPLAANTAASHLSGRSVPGVAGIIADNTKMIRCNLLDAEGNPYKASKMSRFYICDLLSRPFQTSPGFSDGEITFTAVNKPFRISLPVEVPGFGEIFLYADNGGKGYTAASLKNIKSLFLNYEFAADRLSTINTLKKECEDKAVNLSPELLGRIIEADKYFQKCKELAEDSKAVARWSMLSLKESLYAGEMLVLARARHKIAQHGTRNGFLFGCNAFRFRDYGSPYTKLFELLFNFATLPFYLGSTQKIYGDLNYSRVDPLLEALQNTKIISKGHPLIFLVPDSSPEWIKNKPYKEVKRLSLEYIRTTVARYRDRIHIWDVINEAHVQPDIQYGNATIPDYDIEKTIDLSVAASRAAREADPTCFRIINSTGTWADYYMGQHPSPWQQSPFDYIQMLEDANCEYDAIGLQYYHSGRDLLEFERDLDRFSRFNKPIHITELQIPSSSEPIQGKDWWGGGAGGAGLKWHGDGFTEKIQADWVESVYTILYSKPYIDAITYWDMSDPSFVPHGGLVNNDMTPKESYHRLKALLDEWKAKS